MFVLGRTNRAQVLKNDAVDVVGHSPLPVISVVPIIGHGDLPCSAPETARIRERRRGPCCRC
jgi:hypothetical protein